MHLICIFFFCVFFLLFINYAYYGVLIVLRTKRKIIYNYIDPIFKDLTILPFDIICINRIGITMFKVEYELLPKSVIQINWQFI